MAVGRLLCGSRDEAEGSGDLGFGMAWPHLHLDVDGSRSINGVCNEGFTVIKNIKFGFAKDHGLFSYKGTGYCVAERENVLTMEGRASERFTSLPLVNLVKIMALSNYTHACVHHYTQGQFQSP
jgi:hypothetical protein